MLGTEVTELFQNFTSSPYPRSFCAYFRVAVIKEKPVVCCRQERQERSLVGHQIAWKHCTSFSCTQSAMYRWEKQSFHIPWWTSKHKLCCKILIISLEEN